MIFALFLKGAPLTRTFQPLKLNCAIHRSIELPARRIDLIEHVLDRGGKDVGEIGQGVCS